MKLHVGQAILTGDLGRYSRRFDLLEVRSDPGKLPRLSKLRKWSSEVPEGFVFSLLLPRGCSTLESDKASSEALGQALEATEALGAGWVVLQTPPSVTPTARSRERLAAFVEKLPRSERRIGWEPRGLWQDDEAEELASKLGVSLIRDISRSPAPASPIVYSRLRALGSAARLRMSAIERAAQELASASEAYVVIEGPGAVRATALLRELALEQAEYPHESARSAVLGDLGRAVEAEVDGDYLEDDESEDGGLDDDEFEDDEFDDELQGGGSSDDFDDEASDELDAPSKRRDF